MSFSRVFKKAQDSMKGKSFILCVIVFIYMIVAQGASYVESILNMINLTRDADNLIDSTQPLWITIMTLVLQGLLIVGYTNIMLNVARGKNVQLGHLLSHWRLAVKALGLIVIMSIYVMLWSLLFIVPGIIKLISYSMSLYILAEDPSKGIDECITESRRIMYGHKAEVFGIGVVFGVINFLVIMILAAPVGVIGIVFAYNKSNMIMTIFIGVAILIGSVLSLWLYTIQEVTMAHIYLELSKESVFSSIEGKRISVEKQ